MKLLKYFLFVTIGMVLCSCSASINPVQKKLKYKVVEIDSTSLNYYYWITVKHKRVKFSVLSLKSEDTLAVNRKYEKIEAGKSYNLLLEKMRDFKEKDDTVKEGNTDINYGLKEGIWVVHTIFIDDDIIVKTTKGKEKILYLPEAKRKKKHQQCPYATTNLNGLFYIQ